MGSRNRNKGEKKNKNSLTEVFSRKKVLNEKLLFEILSELDSTVEATMWITSSS